MLNIPNPVLQQMFETYTVLDANEQPRTMSSNISAANAIRLYQAVKTYQPRRVLEVGLAYGISALAILTALKELNQGGTLISIDPYQAQSWDDIGLLNIQRAGLADNHEFIRELDYIALPDLLVQGKRFDFVYLDGWHIFDYVMLDFFYVDKMLDVQGVVGFNDTAQTGIKQTINFLHQYRRYKEVKINIAKSGSSGDKLAELRRRLSRFTKSGNIPQKLLKSIGFRLTSGSLSLADRYFQKLQAWEPGDSEYYKVGEPTIENHL